MDEKEKTERVLNLESRAQRGAAFLEFSRNSMIYAEFKKLWEESKKGLNDIGSFAIGGKNPSAEAQVLGRQFALSYVNLNEDFIQKMIDDGRFAEAELEKLRSETSIVGEATKTE